MIDGDRPDRFSVCLEASTGEERRSSNTGIRAYGIGTAKITIDDVSISNGNIGLQAQGGSATLTVSRSTITNNTGFGVSTISGTANSFGDNRLFGNPGGDGAFTGVIIPHQ